MGDKEREILTQLIIDERVLSHVANKWKPAGLFKNRLFNTIANWCVDYFRKYEKAPNQHIKPIFQRWAERNDDASAVELVESVLRAASREWSKTDTNRNSDYILDEANRLFNRVALQQLSEQIDGLLEIDDIDGALKAKEAFERIDINQTNGIDIFDETLIEEVFAAHEPDLIKYPSGLGDFFHNMLTRDAFVAFEAPEKGGKSVWMMDVAFRAMCQRRKVAFFEVGDQSRSQIMRRIYSRITRKPIFLPKTGKVRYPKNITYNENEHKAKCDWDYITHPPKLERGDIRPAVQKLRRKIKSKDTFWRLSSHSNGSINVEGIRSIIDDWIRDGFVPDVICIDYADILAAPFGVYEPREQINRTWQQMRRMSQDYHCLVVTASQASAKAYKTKTLNMNTFSEDKRKRAHTTATIGISCVEEAIDLQSLVTIVRREGVNMRKPCFAAGNWSIYHPSMMSIY